MLRPAAESEALTWSARQELKCEASKHQVYTDCKKTTLTCQVLLHELAFTIQADPSSCFRH